MKGPEVIENDKYASAEAFYGLAIAYSYVPDLHIMWLLYLCDVHQGKQSYAEAAQCAVAVAGVIMQVFLEHHKLNQNFNVPSLPVVGF